MLKTITRNPKEIKTVLEIPGQVVQTTYGPVEYAINGVGPVVLVIHGTPGGYDQGLLLGELVRPYGFQILSVSRPGYLGTTLSTGVTFESQSKAICELLNVLGIDKVAVMHFSTGGPVGYTFCNLYPERVFAQIAVDSISTKYDSTVSGSKIENIILTGKMGLWLVDLVMSNFPKETVSRLLESGSTVSISEIEKSLSGIIKDEWKLEMVKGFIKTICPTTGVTVSPNRKSGLDNDIRNLSNLNKLNLSSTICPTLIIHGEKDGVVSVSNSSYAHESIRNSNIYIIPGAYQMGFILSDLSEKVMQNMVSFLTSNIPVTTRV